MDSSFSIFVTSALIYVEHKILPQICFAMGENLTSCFEFRKHKQNPQK